MLHINIKMWVIHALFLWDICLRFKQGIDHANEKERTIFNVRIVLNVVLSKVIVLQLYKTIMLKNYVREIYIFVSCSQLSFRFALCFVGKIRPR